MINTSFNNWQQKFLIADESHVIDAIILNLENTYQSQVFSKQKWRRVGVEK